MADYERTVLDFYQLSTPYPSEWPAEKEDPDSQDDEREPKPNKHNRRKSRYQALERAAHGRRSLLPAAENQEGGLGNLVQKDEPDPLGSSESVVRALRLQGLSLQDDARLRNRFLLSSTTFSPALFLSQMHANANTNQLVSGLGFLSQSIDQKSASLKVLVESNFERFVRAKATIDNVYKEMKYQGVDPNNNNYLRAHGHSRHASRSSFRNSMSGSPMTPNPSTPGVMGETKKKNALVKESEYGVAGVKAPLLDVSAKAEEVWGPALGNREKEEDLRNLSSYMNRHKEYVELSATIADSIKRKDYETLIEEYNRARNYGEEARKLSRQNEGLELSDAHLYQILLAGRMWHDVDQQIQAFKRDLWKKLVTPQPNAKVDGATGRDLDQHSELIALLLEFGVEDNPIWVWLLSRYDYLKSKVRATADRAKVEIEVLRRRLANGEKPTPQTVASHLRLLGRKPAEDKPATTDSSEVLELWEKMLTFLNNMLSSQGVLGEVVDFWQTAQGFINGKTQATLPFGYQGESKHHHQLSDKAVADLQQGVVDLVEILHEHVYEFFAAPPPQDVSLLLSPASPATPVSASSALTPRDPRFKFDTDNPPPASPKLGESWEKLAFWPPWSNSISGIFYLSKMLALVGSGASEMASLGPVAEGGGQVVERLRTLVGVSRERCVTALCAAWNRDAENIKHVEDWQRSADDGDVTRMPAAFSAFEEALLLGMQKILYVSEAMSKPGAGDIVLAPPTKVLQMVRSQYVTTLYKALSGMVENAERAIKMTSDEWSMDADTSITAILDTTIVSKSTLDAGDRNVRMLLTLSNLQALRSKVVPSLNSQFENAFSVKLTDESKTIRDVLGQIDARLFQSYTKQPGNQVRDIIHAGLADPDWVPAPNTRPTTAKPYVYEVLLTLVLVHSQVSTTAAALTSQVLSFLLEQTSIQLLDAFRKRQRYTLEALVQATLDVEFIAQTLSHYTTDRTSELQGQIYAELDSRTDNDARQRLQNELPEMRSVLKKLRDASKNEFACFKRPKKPGHITSRTNSGLSM